MDITQFLDDKGHLWPYNSIRRTRSGLHPKWMLIHQKNHGVCFRPNGFFVCPAGNLPTTAVQNIIISESGYPLPPVYCEVAEVVEHWGRGINPRWEQKVLEWFYQDLRHGCPEEKCDLFHGAIHLLIDAMNETRAEILQPYFLSEEWNQFFEVAYLTDHDFYSLAVKSVQFCDGLFEERRNELSFARQQERILRRHERSQTAAQAAQPPNPLPSNVAVVSP